MRVEQLQLEREGEKEPEMKNDKQIPFIFPFDIRVALTINHFLTNEHFFCSSLPHTQKNSETDTVTLRTGNQRNCRYSNQVEI